MTKSLLKNSTVKMIASLAVVGILSGALLVLVYEYSTPKIRVNVENETERAIKNIFPEAVKINKTKEPGFFSVQDAKEQISGYAFIAEGNGYQGVIKLIIGVDPKLTEIKGMEVLDSAETPGLGAEIAEDKFRKQFEDLSARREIEYVKNQTPNKPYEIEAITGATISSRAVVAIVNNGMSGIRKKIEAGKL